MFFVDSHCHLNVKKFSKITETSQENYSIESLLTRAYNVGVKYILNIGTELADIGEMHSISASHAGVFHTIGIHPLEAQRHLQQYSLQDMADTINSNCNNEKLAGIGEIGLVYYYTRENEQEQKKIFELQMDIATKHGLPVAIHSREAEADTLAILQNYSGARGVMHCFSGSRDFAFGALDLGFYISFSGVVTFKNSTRVQEIVSDIPSHRLLVETDAPFLAPNPFRGKANEPAFLVHTAKKIADLCGTTSEKIAHATSQNFFNLFSKAKIFCDKE
ncbi:MAG: TatD family hydrolase [Holosporaceae bacterium]|jgi:TatD DNase family protein|nr:TatD family hydrolase [Holosporaceae bacterium]